MKRRKFMAGTGAATGAVLLSSIVSPFAASSDAAVIIDEAVPDKTINSVPQIIIFGSLARAESIRLSPLDEIPQRYTIGWKAIGGGEKYGNYEILEIDPDEMSSVELQAAVNEMLDNAGIAMQKVWTGVPISFREAVKKQEEYMEAQYERPKRWVDVPGKSGWYRYALKRDRI